ncbi:MAG: FecR domain-containing protein [Dongiaceae bacterium]
MFSSLMRSIVGAALLGVVLSAAIPAAADELAAIDPQARVGTAGWRVDGVSGEATLRRGTAPAARLAVGQVVSIGSEIRTGAGAVVFLSRNGDRLIIQPGSQVRIAEPEPGGLLDRFMQSLGSVFYDVEPRKNRSFGVTAPYVAAVVKGTRFLVTVEPQMNSVRVDEGRVLVTSEDGAASVLVDGGQIAIVEPTYHGIRVDESGIPLTDTAGLMQSPAGGAGIGGEGATGAVGSAVAGVGNAVTQTSSAVGSAIGKVSGGLGETVGGVSGALGDAVGGVGGAVGNAVGGLGGAVGNAVGGAAGSAVGGAAGAVGGAVGGLSDGVGDAVGGLGGAVGSTVGGLGGAVGGVVGGLGGAVGGLLGGKK